MNIFFDYFRMNVLPKSLESNNRFLSEEIKKYIKQNLNNFRMVDYNNSDILIEIYKNGEKAISELAEAREIYKEVLALAKYTNTISKKPIKCYIYLVDVKKKIDNNKDNITSAECNSGSTTFYKNYLEIVIWRCEEWQKVLYHELIHAMYLDKEILIQDYMKEMRLKELFPHYNNSIYEAYTEILATILWVKKTKPNAISDLEIFKDQNLFLGTQVNKIIYFLTKSPNSSSSKIENRNGSLFANPNGSSFANPNGSLFANPNGSSFANSSFNFTNSGGNYKKKLISFFRNPRILLDDSTNTSSYYILKSIYLWNAIYKDNTLLDVKKLIDKEFIKKYFYNVFINSLEKDEYLEWLNEIFFIPKNNSLRLTYQRLE